jgi:hypothetical protein
MEDIFDKDVPIKQTSIPKKSLTINPDVGANLGPGSEEESGYEFSNRKSRRLKNPVTSKSTEAQEKLKELSSKKGKSGKRGGGQSGGAGENFYSVPQINFGASSLSYYTTIYLELEKGTVLTASKSAKASCDVGYNKILFNLSKFLGKEPVIQPDINKLPDSILNPTQNNNNSNNNNNNRRFNYSRRGGKYSNKNNKTKKIKNKK